MDQQEQQQHLQKVEEEGESNTLKNDEDGENGSLTEDAGLHGETKNTSKDKFIKSSNNKMIIENYSEEEEANSDDINRNLNKNNQDAGDNNKNDASNESSSVNLQDLSNKLTEIDVKTKIAHTHS